MDEIELGLGLTAEIEGVADVHLHYDDLGGGDHIHLKAEQMVTLMAWYQEVRSRRR